MIQVKVCLKVKDKGYIVNLYFDSLAKAADDIITAFIHDIDMKILSTKRIEKEADVPCM